MAHVALGKERGGEAYDLPVMLVRGTAPYQDKAGAEMRRVKSKTRFAR